MRNLQFTLFFAFLGCLLVNCASEKYRAPLSPEESLATFELDENFEVNLFASEPHVMDPVEMIFDEQGNIFVVEMPDYPFQPEGPAGKGRIKKLVDRDQDGVIDDAIIFADGIKDATSLQCWKGGLLVTAAPYIYHMIDTTGDHIADVKDVLFQGFFKDNQEAQISNLRFNLDNWIYATNHGNAGNIHFSNDPGAPSLDLSGTDFRFRLDRNLFEPATGTAQFGQTFNDWGHRFISHNTTHIRETVIPWRYTNRGSNLLDRTVAVNISDHDLLMYQISEAPYWRVERSRRRQEVFDAQNLNRVEYVEGHFSGCSGGTHYGGELFPTVYQGNIFTGDVMGNLVHRDVLELASDKPTYAAHRHDHDETHEFLASTDTWFRPANFCVGPDGALYVVDMYRQHIETPLSIPEDLKEEMDFMAGEDKGRIFRITPKGNKGRDVAALFSEEDSPEKYLAWLRHPNQWFRNHAQRILIEQHEQSIVPDVIKILMGNPDPVLRLHALYVLEGLSALDVEIIKKALADEHPRLREHALMLAEKHPTCLAEMLSLSKDSNVRVVFQSALSLGSMSAKEVVPALAQILEDHPGDPWIQKAVLSSQSGSSAAMMHHLASHTELLHASSREDGSLIKAFGHSIGSRNDLVEVESFLNLIPILPPESGADGINGFASAIEKNKLKLSNGLKEDLQKMSANGDPVLTAAIKALLQSS